jgi:hypothetical protein
VTLAAADDVAHELGLDSADELTDAQALRVPSLLARASHLFQQAAERQFTLDSYTVRLKVNAGQIRLPESPVIAVHSVVDDDGEPVEYTRSGQWLTVDKASHVFCTVEYTGGAIPDAVRSAVAAIAARYLSIDPQAVAGAKQVNLTTGPFQSNITYQDWASDSVCLSEDDQLLAESFRYPGTQVIVMQP